MGQGPATEATHLGLKSTSSFFSNDTYFTKAIEQSCDDSVPSDSSLSAYIQSPDILGLVESG